MPYVSDQYRSELVFVKLARLHDQLQHPVRGGEHPDVVERVPVDHGQVGERAGRDHAEFPLAAQQPGGGRGGRPDQVGGRLDLRPDDEFISAFCYAVSSGG